MTSRFTIPLSLLLPVVFLTGCPQPSAQPQQAKAAKVEAKFVPENPNFTTEGVIAEETADEANIRNMWNGIQAGESTPIAAADYTRSILLDLPFGADEALIEKMLLATGKLLQDSVSPIYDPTLLEFTSRRYALPEVMFQGGSTKPWAAEVTVGLHKGQFGDLRLLFTDIPDGGIDIAHTLTAIYGPTIIDKMQEPDPAGKVHRKMITLTWRVAAEGKRSGFISYQVAFEGPIAGDADHLLQPGDRFVQASFTTMSPDMMTALRAAHPVGSGTTQ